MIQRHLACTLLILLLFVLRPSATWAQASASSPRPQGSGSALRKLAPDVAFADLRDPNPGSGRGLILTGWIGLGIATLAGAQGPLCSLNTYDTQHGERRCVKLSIGFAVAALTVAVPCLVFGYRRRRAQNEWKLRHGLSALATHMSLFTEPRGALLAYQVAAF